MILDLVTKLGLDSEFGQNAQRIFTHLFFNSPEDKSRLFRLDIQVAATLIITSQQMGTRIKLIEVLKSSCEVQKCLEYVQKQ
jgi:hypothetical protein